MNKSTSLKDRHGIRISLSSPVPSCQILLISESAEVRSGVSNPLSGMAASNSPAPIYQGLDEKAADAAVQNFKARAAKGRRRNSDFFARNGAG